MKHLPRRRGIASIYFGIVGLSLALLFALAIDHSRYYFCFHQLQAAADSAALSALNDLPADLTIASNLTKAQTDAAQPANRCDGTPIKLLPNPSNDVNGDLSFGKYDFKTRTFTTQLNFASAAKVNARRDDSHDGPINLIFTLGTKGNANNGKSYQTATAVATIAPGPGILTLNKKAPKSFNGQGTPNLVINNGALQVNSSDPNAAQLGGNASVDATAIDVVGGTNMTGDNVHLGVKVLNDPLAGLPPLAVPPDASMPTIKPNTIVILDQGHYPNGININENNVTLKLNSGIYYLDGDFDFKGTLIGTDVLIYLHNTAQLKLNGTGAINLTPLTSGPYAGITIWQDAADTSDANLGGGGQLNVSGTLYFPSATLNINGNSSTVGNQIIADQVNMQGKGTITVDFDGRNNPDPTPILVPLLNQPS